jgi:hypothetical protein
MRLQKGGNASVTTKKKAQQEEGAHMLTVNKMYCIRKELFKYVRAKCINTSSN